jgi:signal transduction histidine kinase
LLAANPQERVTFNPHPKTLTMAGDYEYFAAQGHHPLAFALSELIDNALSATKANGESDRGGSSSSSGTFEQASRKQRSITVSLLTSSSSDAGLICVSDNGCGMSPKELNQWAVMNLSMEDRGLLQEDQGTGKCCPWRLHSPWIALLLR